MRVDAIEGMIEIRLGLRVHPENTGEIRHTLESLAPRIRAKQGCRTFAFRVSGRSHRVNILQLWSGRARFHVYLASREHRALLGGIRTLCAGGRLTLRSVRSEDTA